MQAENLISSDSILHVLKSVLFTDFKTSEWATAPEVF